MKTAELITPTALKAQGLGPETLVVDVRTPGEFGEAHLEESINLPLADVSRFHDELRGRDLVLVCRTGRRAATARDALAAAGLQGARVLEGGIEAWIAEGHEVRRGRAGMSIERQVRIAAGSLVVLGTVLGAMVSPWWLALSGFVGAGLVFAGITDTCGMALVLGRLPFNRVKAPRLQPARG